MPTAPTDRFDELPAPGERGQRRIGAHRAEQPRMRRSRILLWAAIATVVIVAAGIVGTLWAGGRLTPASSAPAAPSAGPTAEPVLDTSYTVLVLNATPQSGLGGVVSADVVAAGWSPDDVSAGVAGGDDFDQTTVFYAADEDEGAARGLAQAIGGAAVELSQAYQDGEELKQLVVVVGLDRIDGGSATPTD